MENTKNKKTIFIFYKDQKIVLSLEKYIFQNLKAQNMGKLKDIN